MLLGIHVVQILTTQLGRAVSVRGTRYWQAKIKLFVSWYVYFVGDAQDNLMGSKRDC